MLVMFIAAFFSWWYGKGWEQVALSFGRRTKSVANAFSINQLVRTLFAPWRRIISYPGASLGDKMRAWADNLFSRTIGLIVRLIVIFFASLIIVFVGLLTIIEMAIWPLLPPAVIACPILGIVL